MPAAGDCNANPSDSPDRYGLQVVEPPARPGPDLHPRPGQSSDHGLLSLSWFDWGMLATFAVLQLGYLFGLALFARWLLEQIVVT